MRASRALRISTVAALALLAGCPGTSDEGPGGATFTRADLAGRWRYTVLYAGPGVLSGGAGWNRGIIAVDAAGAATLETYEDSTGSTTLPAMPSVTFNIDAAGVVTATTTMTIGSWGKMNPRKSFFVLTSTQGTGASQRMRLALYQRIVPGTSYGVADLAPATFGLRQLVSGTTPSWMRGRVVVAAGGVYSLADVVGPSGPMGDVPNQGTLSIASDGTVATTVEPSFEGFMSADEQTVVGTQTSGGQHLLSLLARSGGTFAQADIAGTWHYVDLAVSSSAAAWIHGTISFDGAGVATFGPQTDSSGATQTPPSATLSVAADGTVTQTSPLPSAFSGVLTPGKDVLLATETHGPGVYGIIVAIR